MAASFKFMEICIGNLNNFFLTEAISPNRRGVNRASIYRKPGFASALLPEADEPFDPYIAGCRRHRC
jgi:hypothetical protein